VGCRQAAAPASGPGVNTRVRDATLWSMWLILAGSAIAADGTDAWTHIATVQVVLDPRPDGGCIWGIDPADADPAPVVSNGVRWTYVGPERGPCAELVRRRTPAAGARPGPEDVAAGRWRDSIGRGWRVDAIVDRAALAAADPAPARTRYGFLDVIVRMERHDDGTVSQAIAPEDVPTGPVVEGAYTWTYTGQNRVPLAATEGSGRSWVCRGGVQPTIRESLRSSRVDALGRSWHGEPDPLLACAVDAHPETCVRDFDVRPPALPRECGWFEFQ
jgi:hypothetical protein